MTQKLPRLLMWVPILLSGQPKRAMTPEDVVDIRQVSDAQISPDGKRVAFVISEAADPNKPERGRDENIWIVPTDGVDPPRRFAASLKSDNSPRWSPDGKWLGFLSDREDAHKQIWLMRSDGGEAEKLTNSIAGVDAFRWSPDGRAIAFLARDGPGQEEEKKRQLQDDAVQVDLDYKFVRLWVVGIVGGSPTLVTRQDVDITDFDWSPDGSGFAVVYTPMPAERATVGQVGIFRRSDGVLLRRLHSGAYVDPWLVRWSPDAKNILFLESSPRESTAWMALVPATGGAAKPLLKEFAGTIRACSWAPDSRHLLAAAVTGTRGKLLQVDTVSGEADTIAEILSGDLAFSDSADGRAFAYVSEAWDSPPDVWVRTKDGARRLTHSNPRIDTLQLGHLTEVSWTNRRDRLKLDGVLVTPSVQQEGKPRPMIVEAHSGDQGWWAGWQGSWWQWAQLMSSHGFVVFLPNARGVTGQTWAIHDTIADWGGAALDDILDGVDELVARKIADPGRLGIGGWSNGGFMGAWTITHTNVFKAAVLHAPVINMAYWWSMTGKWGMVDACVRRHPSDRQRGIRRSLATAFCAELPHTDADSPRRGG